MGTCRCHNRKAMSGEVLSLGSCSYYNSAKREAAEYITKENFMQRIRFRDGDQEPEEQRAHQTELLSQQLERQGWELSMSLLGWVDMHDHLDEGCSIQMIRYYRQFAPES